MSQLVGREQRPKWLESYGKSWGQLETSKNLMLHHHVHAFFAILNSHFGVAPTGPTQPCPVRWIGLSLFQPALIDQSTRSIEAQLIGGLQGFLRWAQTWD